ncbi:hypothetical protein HRR77_009612 [Exophiala dermatitidis]|nr:hypothetical protein HRR77_009612 [Exophiala dermatitidis]
MQVGADPMVASGVERPVSAVKSVGLDTLTTLMICGLPPLFIKEQAYRANNHAPIAILSHDHARSSCSLQNIHDRNSHACASREQMACFNPFICCSAKWP